MRRRRRMQTAGSALAVSVLAIGTFAYTGGAGLFDRKSDRPTDTPPTGVQQLVKATPRGIAASVLQHLDSDAVIGVAGDVQTEQGHSQLIADLGYQVDGKKMEIQVVASHDFKPWARGSCADKLPGIQEVIWCDEQPRPDGTPSFSSIVKAGGESGFAYYMAGTGVNRNDGQLVIALLTFRVPIENNVTLDSLPLSMSELQSIVADPTVGLSTTAALNAQGEAIADFKDSLVTSSSSSGSGFAVDKGSAPEPPPTAGSSSESHTVRLPPPPATTGN